MKTVLLFSFCLIIVTSSCERCDPCEPCNQPEVDRELFNGTWKFVSYKSHHSGEEIFYPDTVDRDITMEIRKSDTIFFIGYCNIGRGWITVFNDTLVNISHISFTQVHCDTPLMVWEDYLYYLGSVSTYTVNDQNLDFYTSWGREHHFIRVQ